MAPGSHAHGAAMVNDKPMLGPFAVFIDPTTGEVALRPYVKGGGGRGATGPAGPVGPEGPAGPQGEPGTNLLGLGSASGLSALTIPTEEPGVALSLVVSVADNPIDVEIVADGSLLLTDQDAGASLGVMYWIEVDGVHIGMSSRRASVGGSGTSHVATPAVTSCIASLNVGDHTITLNAQGTDDGAIPGVIEWTESRVMRVRWWSPAV